MVVIADHAVVARRTMTSLGEALNLACIAIPVSVESRLPVDQRLVIWILRLSLDTFWVRQLAHFENGPFFE